MRVGNAYDAEGGVGGLGRRAEVREQVVHVVEEQFYGRAEEQQGERDRLEGVRRAAPWMEDLKDHGMFGGGGKLVVVRRDVSGGRS